MIAHNKACNFCTRRKMASYVVSDFCSRGNIYIAAQTCHPCLRRTSSRLLCRPRHPSPTFPTWCRVMGSYLKALLLPCPGLPMSQVASQRFLLQDCEGPAPANHYCRSTNDNVGLEAERRQCLRSCSTTTLPRTRSSLTQRQKCRKHAPSASSMDYSVYAPYTEILQFCHPSRVLGLSREYIFDNLAVASVLYPHVRH